MFVQLCFENPLVLSINIWLHSSLCYKCKWEEWGSAIDFAARFLDLRLISLATDNLSFLRSQNCATIIGKNHTVSTEVSASIVSLNNDFSIGFFHVLKTAFINLLENF